MKSGSSIACLVLVFLYKANSFAQTRDPKFTSFQNYYLAKQFEFKFYYNRPTALAIKSSSFTLQTPNLKKPIFCRMEDNISDRYNFIFQIRAGSDEHYRSLAFPERVEKRKRYIE